LQRNAKDPGRHELTKVARSAGPSDELGIRVSMPFRPCSNAASCSMSPGSSCGRGPGCLPDPGVTALDRQSPVHTRPRARRVASDLWTESETLRASSG
jgi:hypothetical protein